MPYFALEGLKGIGKSTTLIELKKNLDQRKIDYISYDLTKQSPLEIGLKLELVSNQNPELRELDDDFCEKLYIERANYHYDQLKISKNQSLVDDPLVIGDRSIITSIVTRWQRVELLGEEQYIESILKSRCFEMPNVIFYLKLPIDQIKERQNYRLGTIGRTYGLREEKIERLLDIEKCYQYLINHCKHQYLKTIKWIEIDASQSTTEITQNILKYLNY